MTTASLLHWFLSWMVLAPLMAARPSRTTDAPDPHARAIPPTPDPSARPYGPGSMPPAIPAQTSPEQGPTWAPSTTPPAIAPQPDPPAPLAEVEEGAGR